MFNVIQIPCRFCKRIGLHYDIMIFNTYLHRTDLVPFWISGVLREFGHFPPKEVSLGSIWGVHSMYEGNVVLIILCYFDGNPVMELVSDMLLILLSCGIDEGLNIRSDSYIKIFIKNQKIVLEFWLWYDRHDFGYGVRIACSAERDPVMENQKNQDSKYATWKVNGAVPKAVQVCYGSLPKYSSESPSPKCTSFLEANLEMARLRDWNVLHSQTLCSRPGILKGLAALASRMTCPWFSILDW